MSSYLSEILNSTSTIEAQANAKGQKWKNYGRQFYQEQTGASDVEMQVSTRPIHLNVIEIWMLIVNQAKTWMDFAAWSPVPWTSEQEEPQPVMAAKARFLGTQSLQTQWNIQVGLIEIVIFCPSFTYTTTALKAPSTHPTGVGVAGHAVILPEASQLPPIPFFSSENIKVKVGSCCWQRKCIFFSSRRGSPMWAGMERTTEPAQSGES